MSYFVSAMSDRSQNIITGACRRCLTARNVHWIRQCCCVLLAGSRTHHTSIHHSHTTSQSRTHHTSTHHSHTTSQSRTHLTSTHHSHTTFINWFREQRYTVFLLPFHLLPFHCLSFLLWISLSLCYSSKAVPWALPASHSGGSDSIPVQCTWDLM